MAKNAERSYNTSSERVSKQDPKCIAIVNLLLKLAFQVQRRSDWMGKTNPAPFHFYICLLVHISTTLCMTIEAPSKYKVGSLETLCI